MLRILLWGKFSRQYLLLIKDNSPIKVEIEKRILWFRKSPKDSRLYNHALGKRMKGKFAFSITGDIRVVYKWVGKLTVRFLAIGGHRQVYKKLP